MVVGARLFFGAARVLFDLDTRIEAGALLYDFVRRLRLFSPGVPVAVQFKLPWKRVE